MSDLTVGKNGIGPPQLAPARIFRPGDPGFPVTGVSVAPKEQSMPAKTRRCVMCSKEYQPASNVQKRCPECRAKVKAPTKPKPEKPSAVAAAIGNLRAKAVPPPVAATLPVQPTGTGGDLYQQLSERRAQMVADIEAIDRVLAII